MPEASEAKNIPEALSRAQAHWNAGQADQAEQLCQRVLAAWPGQADALHLLGLMAHAHGNLELAILRLCQACLSPRAPAVYSSNLAEMYRQKGLLAAGEEAARRAVALEPMLVSGWNNLGIVLQEAGKFAESLACLERVIALQPDWAEAHNNLAFLLSTQGRYDEAAAAAQRAIELSPRLVDAYLNLAEVEISRHRHDAALRALDMLAAFAPRHPAALVARAKALRKIESLDDALAFARQAVTHGTEERGGAQHACHGAPGARAPR